MAYLKEVLRQKALKRIGKEVQFTIAEVDNKLHKGLIVGYDKSDYEPIVMVEPNVYDFINWGIDGLDDSDHYDKKLIINGKRFIYIASHWLKGDDK